LSGEAVQQAIRWISDRAALMAPAGRRPSAPPASSGRRAIGGDGASRPIGGDVEATRARALSPKVLLAIILLLSGVSTALTLTIPYLTKALVDGALVGAICVRFTPPCCSSRCIGRRVRALAMVASDIRCRQTSSST
jgi:hypothetical protein